MAILDLSQVSQNLHCGNLKIFCFYIKPIEFIVGLRLKLPYLEGNIILDYSRVVDIFRSAKLSIISETPIWFREPTCGPRDNSNSEHPIRLIEVLSVAVFRSIFRRYVLLWVRVALGSLFWCNHLATALWESSLLSSYRPMSYN